MRLSTELCYTSWATCGASMLHKTLPYGGCGASLAAVGSGCLQFAYISLAQREGTCFVDMQRPLGLVPSGSKVIETLDFLCCPGRHGRGGVFPLDRVQCQMPAPPSRTTLLFRQRGEEGAFVGRSSEEGVCCLGTPFMFERRDPAPSLIPLLR